MTGDLFEEMAAVFWEKLPQYAGQPKPKFSTGWLKGFKARHSIKKFRQHGEAGAVDLIVVEEELQEIRDRVQHMTMKTFTTWTSPHCSRK